MKWNEIKTFEDAYKQVYNEMHANDEDLNPLYKIITIREALNKKSKYSIINNEVYFPIVHVYDNYEDATKSVNNQEFVLCGKVIIEDSEYYIVGNDYNLFDCGMADMYDGYSTCAGMVDLHVGLLCCDSEEKAKHFSRYFAKEIFEASYFLSANNYKWIKLE
jgi:hypothetical protein